MTSAQNIMLLALLSSLSRAGLNIVDRYQIGLTRLPILQLNLWNNAAPAAAMCCLMTLFFIAGTELVQQLYDWRTVVFSGLAQLVAYSFSYAFRNLRVNQVIVAGKAADLFIPLGIYCTTNQWSWGTYAFSVASTMVCLPILWLRGATGRNWGLLTGSSALFICAALTLQASLSPALSGASFSSATLVFATAVMMWRVLWSLAPVLAMRPADAGAASAGLLLNQLFAVRALLTTITQISFIFVVGRPDSAIAWPILNASGIISMLLAPLILKESGTRIEYAVLCALGGMTLLRFLTLS